MKRLPPVQHSYAMSVASVSGGLNSRYAQSSSLITGTPIRPILSSNTRTTRRVCILDDGGYSRVNYAYSSIVSQE